MKRLLLAVLLLAATATGAHAQPLLRNSITTNALGTNLVWDPVGHALVIENNSGSFSVVSNGLTIAAISPTPGGNVLPALNLLQYLQFNSSTNRLKESGTNLLWNGEALNGGPTGGGGLTTDVTTLTYSGTNAAGFDCATNGMSYFLLLTNHVLFGSSTFANLPTKTTYKTYTLCLQQDSAGGWVPKFTNTVAAWTDFNPPVVKTNAGAVSYIYWHTSLATNSMLVGAPNINVQ